MSITRRSLLATGAMAAMVRPSFAADDEIRIGIISSQTGPFAAVGRQLEGGVKLYLQEHGAKVAGKKVRVIVKDDTGVADVTRRVAQELVANDKVHFIGGFTLTPGALATAPVATQGKVPMIVMLGATSIIPDRSPFIVRSSLSVPQLAIPTGEWAATKGSKTAVTLVADYGPGTDNEKYFSQGFEAKGGKIIAKLRVPLANPEFAPFLQRAIDAKPDLLYCFVPAGGMGATLMKQLKERGVASRGIKLLGEGSMVDDDIVTSMGDAALGMTTTHTYSTAHDSDINRKFVAGFRKLNGRRPNLVGCYAYDGMHLMYESLRKTGGKTDGAALVAAMKTMAWESPRGPVKVDPATRDLVQNGYVRRVERLKDGELYNVEIETMPNLKDPTRPTKT